MQAAVVDARHKHRGFREYTDLAKGKVCAFLIEKRWGRDPAMFLPIQEYPAIPKPSYSANLLPLRQHYMCRLLPLDSAWLSPADVKFNINKLVRVFPRKGGTKFDTFRVNCQTLSARYADLEALTAQCTQKNPI